MKLNYKYDNPRLSRTAKRLGNPLFVGFLAVSVIILLVAFVMVDLWFQNHNEAYPESKTIVRQTPIDIKFYSTPYFQFADTGNWHFEKNQSNADTFVFQKYLGKSIIVQHRLTVYINHTPIPLYLASPRTIPVNIKSGQIIAASDVSMPCGQKYGAHELHKIKTLSIDGTSILCDPDLTEYRVVFGQIGGNYSLRLKRSNGLFANYIVIYQGLVLSPKQDTIKQIADSFQAL